MSSSDKNKLKQGDYYRKIISDLNINLQRLQDDKVKYGRIMRFVRGINRNIRTRKQQIKYYQRTLDKAIKDGWAS